MQILEHDQLPVDDPQWQRLDPPLRRVQTLDAIKRLLLRESQVKPLANSLDHRGMLPDAP
jgi:hypothetical protein